jgi:hypothetical protein
LDVLGLDAVSEENVGWQGCAENTDAGESDTSPMIHDQVHPLQIVPAATVAEPAASFQYPGAILPAPARPNRPLCGTMRSWMEPDDEG